ncbi:prepilin-type N-terminal cleavage/methylation domain-containing protein [Bermanella marisrubri]|uniref:Type II secretion system protein H n=1 Tax=Bermanella marisrubri TaxID=207949 RepID=Q1MYR6_9GAMM|nr:GspH/FimT family pseudopilin [Bermanella marisrubri]EAT11140.1 putative type-4 fimbrial pilin related signal peptide protein [Oceanobacter sp. RED65] [Bermanella marisrubri]QIZ85756.1 prepilin-type N-terminal cleavage/methylation domain-containing protein [Bermanella marisrubri]
MRKKAGFSLIELMITLVILGIIASAVVPQLGSLFTRKNIESIGKTLEQSFRLARTEAVNRGVPVMVKPSEASGNWADGWEIVFTNSDGDEELIRHFSAISSGAKLTSSEFSVGTPLTIDPNGKARSVGSFSLDYDDCQKSNHDLKFDILISGLVKRSKTSCN